MSKGPTKRAGASKPRVSLMMDSGVFSAWGRGEELKLADYIAYLKDNRDLLFSYVNMDKIPGTFRMKRTRDQVEDSARVSYDNLEKMKGAGLAPLPVFHQGESFKWLERMISDGETYIGISTAKDLHVKEHKNWLDEVFTAICGRDGLPVIKTHGLGVTRPALMLSYPWYSCDSTTWALMPGFGQVWIPPYTNGQPNYDVLPAQLVISDVERINSFVPNRYDNIGEHARAAVRRFFDECGVTIEEARYLPTARVRSMIYYFSQFERRHSIAPFHKPRGFHSIPVGSPIKNPERWQRMRIMLAAQITHKSWSGVMNELGAMNRLLNYYDMRGRKPGLLEQYVMEGTIGEYKAHPIKADWSKPQYTSQRAMNLMKRLKRMEGEEHA